MGTTTQMAIVAGVTGAPTARQPLALKAPPQRGLAGRTVGQLMARRDFAERHL